MSEVLSDLLRLERWGSENSETVGMLRVAAERLAVHLVGLLPDRPNLPRGYWIGASPSGRTLYHEGGQPVSASRWYATRFADDIAHGWLDELADWLDEHVGWDSTGSAAVCDIRSLADAVRNAQNRRRRG